MEQQGTPVQDSQQSVETQPTAEPTYDVTIDGRVEKLPVSELTKGYLRQSDYTRKTQEISQARREWEAEQGQVQEFVEKVSQLLGSKELLMQYIQEAFAEEQAAQQAQPNQLLTRAEFEKALAAERRKVQEEIAQGTRGVEFKTEVAQLTSEYTREVNAKLEAIKKEFPIFGNPRWEHSLRTLVKSRKPGSIEEALQVFEEEARNMMGDVNNQVKASVAKPALVRTEPRGGTVAQPAAEPKYSSLRDPRLRAAILEDLTKSAG